jgi:hypothetical protein
MGPAQSVGNVARRRLRADDDRLGGNANVADGEIRKGTRSGEVASARQTML